MVSHLLLFPVLENGSTRIALFYSFVDIFLFGYSCFFFYGTDQLVLSCFGLIFVLIFKWWYCSCTKTEVGYSRSAKAMIGFRKIRYIQSSDNVSPSTCRSTFKNIVLFWYDSDCLQLEESRVGVDFLDRLRDNQSQICVMMDLLGCSALELVLLPF